MLIVSSHVASYSSIRSSWILLIFVVIMYLSSLRFDIDFDLNSFVNLFTSFKSTIWVFGRGRCWLPFFLIRFCVVFMLFVWFSSFNNSFWYKLSSFVYVEPKLFKLDERLNVNWSSSSSSTSVSASWLLSLLFMWSSLLPFISIKLLTIVSPFCCFLFLLFCFLTFKYVSFSIAFFL